MYLFRRFFGILPIGVFLLLFLNGTTEVTHTFHMKFNPNSELLSVFNESKGESEGYFNLYIPVLNRLFRKKIHCEEERIGFRDDSLIVVETEALRK
jgi:hypothetical protein